MPQSMSMGEAWQAFESGLQEFKNSAPLPASAAKVLDAARSKIVRQISDGTECVEPGCTRPPVKSHVIARRSGIDPLVDQNHRVTAPFLDNNTRAQVREVYARSATVFKGYCSVHEGDFHDFEQQKLLSTPSHYALQLKRSSAREEFVWHARWKAVDEALALVRDLIQDHSTDDARKGYWTGQIEDPLVSYFIHVRLRLDHFSFVHSDVVSQVAAKDAQLPPWIHCFSHPATYPVAISGSSDLLMPDRLVPFVFVSIPNGDDWLTIFGATKDDAQAVDAFAQRFASDDQMREKLLLEWMAYSDHWVARTDWWKLLSGEVRQAILTGLELGADRATFTTKIADRIDEEFRS